MNVPTPASRFVVAAFLTCLLAFGQAPPTQLGVNASPPTIPLNTIVELQLVSKIDSTTAHIGDPVDLELSRAIVRDGAVIIPKGTPVLGEVTAVKRRGILGRGGTVQIEALEICLKNGDTIPLQGSRGAKEGRRIGGIMLGAAAAGLIVSGIAAPLALLIPGRSSAIPAGTRFLGRVGAAEGATATAGRGEGTPRTKETNAERPPDASPSSHHSTPLSISTFPANAHVVIDGKRVGDSPVSAMVAAGKHELNLSLPGYTSFQRTIQADGTPLNLEYVLDPSPTAPLGKLLGGG